MTRLSATLICVLLAATQLCSQTLPQSRDTVIRRLGEKLLREKEGVGLSLGILYRGETYYYNFGQAEKDGGEPLSQRSLYEIGSITKTFVGLLLARAVNEGRARMDDDIRKYFDQPFPGLEYNHHPVQLLHLANMTSGLPDNLPAPTQEMRNAPEDSVDVVRGRTIAKYTIDTLFKALATVKPDTIPGAVPRHSNVGAQLLAHIVEKIYGRPIDELIRDMITQPLAMNNTRFPVPGNKPVTVQGHDGKGKPVRTIANLYYRGAGGMISCTEDLLKYLSFLMKQDDANTRLVMRKTILMDAVSNKVVGVYPENRIDPTKYSASINWYHYTPAKNKTRIWTDGGTSGFASYIVMYPEADLGVILLSNKTGEKIFRSLPGTAAAILDLFLGVE
ncbi:beta-lactamase family protein [Sediminibacterium roseum]|uniref:Beta-lactamase family protein n=1 Tax=Sediminibacterium roseum TaxID=1978412 RepID=A0ABW9ZW77_9BACT|nr:serine hydrolase domain-containing protein [Sediminibacterium roseum]NCI49962.1 beta-lactamase family protein [Sediminibacterium roseum]